MPTRICRRAGLASKLSRAHFSNLMYGIVPSKIKGPGFEYVDLREYSPGDDIRFIDWRASARMIKPDGDYRLMVKEHLLERLVNNIVVLDYSKSMLYGDKIESAIYVLTGFLSIAHSLGDIIDLIILHGEKPLIKHGLNPLEAINFSLNTICKVDPSGNLDLIKLSNYVKNLKNRETLLLITDYAHYPIEFEVLATTTHAMNTGLGIVLVSTKLELNPPSLDGYHAFYDLESADSELKTMMSEYYRAVKTHIIKTKTALAKTRTPYIEIKELRDAMYKKLRLLKLYSITRIRYKRY
ncbi:DUF58 domain-containing protein [Staphylothermus hellenicus]|uniref:DUF58 domain-containing protein n=1 Tax=Staphylothermus hellenicus (strain DSM 12710 / JCM 10830 / BK20S6-10-b1 / P8) TaxID=591019 RepID=D7D9B4_STAHD|nr:DUF58 domain-containing protein [Staphylothermus hellenicus]ADI32360.1 conserved hypothetical protein [Staphylothermus hellenicus DSM 12710]